MSQFDDTSHRVTSLQEQAELDTQRHESCPRTLALVLPCVRIAGVGHMWRFRGEVPCTGPKVCLLCGSLMHEED
jgi:hypothetical protein